MNSEALLNSPVVLFDFKNETREKDQFQVDLSNHFQTEKNFCSKEELIDWCRCVSKNLGYVITIKTSDKVIGRLTPRVILGCDRSGYYRENQNKKDWVKKGLRKPTSKRCGCLFSLKGVKVANMDEWRLEVLCGLHNHDRVHLEAHAFAGRLEEEEEKLVKEMFSAGVKPRKILTAVKNKNIGNTSVMRTIYNARAKLQKEELDGLSPIQFLYKLINRACYVSFNKVNESTQKLESLFFAHPVSIKLTNMFPTVFVLDCTYKTNRYRMPLLSIVGMTSTTKSFYSCFAFISDETQSSYEWALHCFKSLFPPDYSPNVLVTDRELALLNAIKTVFPKAKNLLCRVHINRNILAHCKKLFSNGKDFESFMFEWQKLIETDSENDFKRCFNELIARFSTLHSKVLEYVTMTWLESYKECFVSAWIDKFLHFGNSSTNRVEGGHSLLKKFLEVSIGNFTTVWKIFDQMINLQHTDIRRSFGESCIKFSNDFNGFLYSELVGKVSIQALKIIKEEEDQIKRGHFKQANECTHLKRYTLGLPCAHELLPYVTNSKGIPLWLINGHWKKLVLNERFEVDIEDNIDTELEGITQKFYDSNKQQKQELKRKLRELINPTSAQTMEPSVPIKLKGRSKGSNKKFKEDVLSTKRLPSHFEYALLEDKVMENNKIPKRNKLSIRKSIKFVDKVRPKFAPYWSEHITDALDVLGDGHCGYRVISQALNIEGGWAQVRLDLQWELENRNALYGLIFGRKRYEELLLSVQCTDTPAPFTKWMTMPDIGLIISSCYNIALVQLSKVQSLTFLPLHSSMPEIPSLVCIGFLNDNHFIQLMLKDCSPIPQIFSTWMRYHEQIAEGWEIYYNERITNAKAATAMVQLYDME